MYYIKLLAVIYFCLPYAYGNPECQSFNTCGRCIGYAFDKCVWCSAEEHVGRRCQTKKYNEENKSWCKIEIYDPQPENSLEQDDDFNTGENGSAVVQFKPQLIKVKARPGVPIKIKTSYKPAKDYPLDVYYLLDYSGTMEKKIKLLQKQGTEAYKQLIKLTNNVRFGLGSFKEKPAVPFINTKKYDTYSFRNNLKLSENVTLFEQTLLSSQTSSNRDDPEAGFDALMQSMVCIDKIGWRNKARRIMVLCTDDTYHQAGDGKFVGALIPNDMECHLENDSYTMDLTMDYPSVSQINKVAMDKNIKIIFACHPYVAKVYMALEEKIKGAKYVEFNDSSNVVEMIKKEYLEAVRHIKIQYDAPDYIQLQLNPNCNINDNCTIKHNEQLDIECELTVTSCPDNRNVNHQVIIKPTGLNEELKIDFEVDCKCECENAQFTQLNSTKCSNGGDYQCGVCRCYENRYGDVCQCNGTSTQFTDLDKCKTKPNDTVTCSGRGICKCGKCEDCEQGFSGDFCQFNDFACSRSNGILCAGHGRCRFQKCECESRWTGDDCSCLDEIRSCIAPYSKEVCSGNGDCKCGECKCKNAECSGRFCDDCDELTGKRCNDLEDYAYCNFNKNKSECDQQYNHTETEIRLVNRSEIGSSEWYKAHWCTKQLEDGTALIFRYIYKETFPISVLLIIQKELEKPPEANTWVVVGSTVGAVILIGLLTLLAWKILIDMHDEKEFEKFVNDKTSAKYETVNNIYQDPFVKVSNPAYRISHYN